MGRPKKKIADNAVKKHSAAIQIEGNITLLQRKTWNVLLWNAYDELATKDRHAIRVPYLIHTLGFNSDHDEYLKDALKALVHCSVEWNILDKDGAEEWGVAALLASAKISRGVCVYEYSSILREKLYNPDMYARLDLDLQKRFGSKHALALWELSTDYLGSKRDYGETPWILVEDFRKLFGIAKNEYPAFWRIIQKVITPALAEVNHVSDFNVTVEYQREGRKTTALKFKMHRVTLLPEPANTQASLFPDLDDMPALVRELTDVGLSTQDAFEIWQRGFGFVDTAQRPNDTGEDAETAFTRYVREKIHLLKRRQSSGKVDNLTGFLREAIKKNYANPEYGFELQSQAAAEARQSRREREPQVRGLEAQKAALELARDKELRALCGRIAEASPEVLEAALPELMAKNFLVREHYKSSKSALENYRERAMLELAFTPYLERHSPEPFQTLRQDYAARVAAIDEQIAAVG